MHTADTYKYAHTIDTRGKDWTRVKRAFTRHVTSTLHVYHMLLCEYVRSAYHACHGYQKNTCFFCFDF